VILELLTDSVDETIKKASVITFALSRATQGFVKGSQKITNLIQLSCIVRRVVSGILIVGYSVMQQPASFQITSIDYSGAIRHPKRTRKKNLQRVSGDGRIRLSPPTVATRFVRQGTELRDFSRKIEKHFFSFTVEEPDEQQKEEQEKSSPSFFNFNNSYLNKNTLYIIDQARDTVNWALREGFELSSTIDRTLKTGFIFYPQIISAKQTIYADGSRSDRDARTRPKLTNTLRTEQVIDPNYQSPLLRASYKHDHGPKDKLLPPGGTQAKPHQSYLSSSEEGLPRQPEDTKSHRRHHHHHPNVDKTQSSYSKLPEAIAASLPSMLYRALPYNDIISYSKINLDDVEKIAQLSGKIVFDRIRYRVMQDEGGEEEKERLGQTIQKLEQSNYENSHTLAYKPAIADIPKIIGNIDDNYYSFDYPAITIAKTLSQKFRFPKPLEIIQRSYIASSSYIPDAGRVVPQKIANLAIPSSARTDDKIPSSDKLRSPSSLAPLLNGTVIKDMISAMRPLMSSPFYGLTVIASSLATTTDKMPLNGRRTAAITQQQQNLEAEKKMTRMMGANSAWNTTYEAFLDSINGGKDSNNNNGSHLRINTPRYDRDVDVHYQLKGQDKIEDEELELRDLKRKIEQILNEELRKYGFQI
jgi:hypothetical protein